MFYLKVGVDAAREEATLETVRSTIGAGRRIRIDANEAWTLTEAVRLLTRWHALVGLDMAEAPVKAFPITLMKELRLRTTVAICANEGLGSEADVIRMILSGAADFLCFSSYWVGSLRRFHTLSHAANWHDIRICKHTHGELGIAASAGHHVLLTLPNALDGCQQTAAMLLDDVLANPLPISQGPQWGLIEGPGLGIEIDEDKLRYYNDVFHRQGQFLPYAA